MSDDLRYSGVVYIFDFPFFIPGLPATPMPGSKAGAPAPAAPTPSPTGGLPAVEASGP